MARPISLIHHAMLLSNTALLIAALLAAPQSDDSTAKPDAPAARAEYVLPSYANEDAYTTEEVALGLEPWQLRGTLSLPKHAKPIATVILVHGSGGGDRDGTLGPNKPYLDIAAGLATRGIASLCYDKRTGVYGKEMAKDTGMTVKEETVDDVLFAAGFLRAHEILGKTRVIVIGHSLGGYLLPRIDEADNKGLIDGYVSLAGNVTPVHKLIVTQLEYLSKLDGMIGFQVRMQLKPVREMSAEIEALTPESDPAKFILGAPPAYWLDLKHYDPPTAALEVKEPILFLQGERDYQVPPSEFEAWRKVLGPKKNATFKQFEGLNHLFIKGEGKCTPKEYKVAGNVAQPVIDALEAFVNSVATVEADAK